MTNNFIFFSEGIFSMTSQSKPQNGGLKSPPLSHDRTAFFDQSTSAALAAFNGLPLLATIARPSTDRAACIGFIIKVEPQVTSRAASVPLFLSFLLPPPHVPDRVCLFTLPLPGNKVLGARRSTTLKYRRSRASSPLSHTIRFNLNPKKNIRKEILACRPRVCAHLFDS